MTDSFIVDDTLTVAEAAALLGCSGQTVRERIKRGELGGLLVRTPTGKQWRVLRSGLLAQASERHNPDGGITGTSTFGASDEVPNQEVDHISTLPATLPQREPGVVEALGLLRESLQREAQLQAENARLRDQLAAQPLALAAPAVGFWMALWLRVSQAALGRPG